MRGLLIFLAALLLSGPAALQAQPAGNDQAILQLRAAEAVAVMQQIRPASEVFNSSFLAEVPAQQLAGIVSQLEAQNGKLLRYEGLTQTAYGTANMALLFERARAQAFMVLEPGQPRRIATFRITGITAQMAPPAPRNLFIPGLTPRPGTVQQQNLAADFDALPGVAGFSVARLDPGGPTVIQSHRGDQPLAIASAFKLWVLDAVAEDVSQGRLSWDQMVVIGPQSLSSAGTQNWAPGTTATLERFATLMISVSDNTATDTLIRLVGRDRLEARLAYTGHSRPDLLRPFLLTSDAFNLKLGPQALRDNYAKADTAGRRAILSALPQGVDPTLVSNIGALASGAPVAIDSVEWFASPNDIARIFDKLMRRVDPKVLQILGSNPSLPATLANGFTYSGFKGGSEPGVRNLSWLLRRPDGTWYVVTTTWDNKTQQLGNSQLEPLAQRLIALTQ